MFSVQSFSILESNSSSKIGALDHVVNSFAVQNEDFLCLDIPKMALVTKVKDETIHLVMVANNG